MKTRFLVVDVEGDPIAQDIPTLEAAIEEACEHLTEGGPEAYIYQAVRLVKQETKVIALDGDSIDG